MVLSKSDRATVLLTIRLCRVWYTFLQEVVLNMFMTQCEERDDLGVHEIYFSFSRYSYFRFKGHSRSLSCAWEFWLFEKTYFKCQKDYAGDAGSLSLKVHFGSALLVVLQPGFSPRWPGSPACSFLEVFWSRQQPCLIYRYDLRLRCFQRTRGSLLLIWNDTKLLYRFQPISNVIQ